MTRNHYSRSWAVENLVMCEYYDTFMAYCIFREHPSDVRKIGVESESKGFAIRRRNVSASEWTGINFHK